MSARRVLASLVLTLSLAGASLRRRWPSTAASAATDHLGLAVDSRTMLTWTSVKGAHHYVVTSSAGQIYTTATTARITDLYPGDEHVFFVTPKPARPTPDQ